MFNNKLKVKQISPTHYKMNGWHYDPKTIKPSELGPAMNRVLIQLNRQKKLVEQLQKQKRFVDKDVESYKKVVQDLYEVEDNKAPLRTVYALNSDNPLTIEGKAAKLLVQTGQYTFSPTFIQEL